MASAPERGLRLGEVMRDWRIMQRLSQREVSELTGVDHGTLARLEMGNGGCTARVVRLLLDFLLSESPLKRKTGRK